MPGDIHSVIAIHNKSVIKDTQLAMLQGTIFDGDLQMMFP
jgi:hypothetical protein